MWGACARPYDPLSLCPSELGSADCWQLPFRLLAVAIQIVGNCQRRCWQLSTTNGDWFQPHSDQYKTMLKVVVGKLLSILHFLLPRKIPVESYSHLFSFQHIPQFQALLPLLCSSTSARFVSGVRGTGSSDPLFSPLL